MEKCEEYMYSNALNIFSVTIGPFEKYIPHNDEQNANAIAAQQMD